MSNRCIALWLVGLSFCACLNAQTIPSAVQSAGGTVAANQHFRIQASCGQTVIGPTTGAQNVVHAGFWQSPTIQSQMPVAGVETTGLELQLQPQPAQSMVRVRFIAQQKQQISIELLNLLGERFLRIEDVSDGTVYSRDVDLSDVPSGTYTLRVISDHATQSQICVVQH